MMTAREFFTAVVNGEMTVDVTAYAENALQKMDSRNDKRRKNGTKKTEENMVLMDKILNAMEDDTIYTAAQIFKMNIDERITSTQKVSALMAKLVNLDYVSVETIKDEKKNKVKGYTRIVD